jgi:hypothetical protein
VNPIAGNPSERGRSDRSPADDASPPNSKPSFGPDLIGLCRIPLFRSVCSREHDLPVRDRRNVDPTSFHVQMLLL